MFPLKIVLVGNAVMVGKVELDSTFLIIQTVCRRSLQKPGIDVSIYLRRVVQPSGWGACLEIWRSWVQDTFWLLVLIEFVPGSPWFNFLAALLNSQLVYLQPVGILNVVLFNAQRYLLLATLKIRG